MPFDRAPQSSGTLNTSRARPGHRAAASIAAWAAQAMADLAPAEVASSEYDGWTPKRAGEALIDALRWARYAAGRTGPSGFTRFVNPFVADLETHTQEGWGLPESADEPDAAFVRVQPSARQVTRHEAALQWPAVYLVGAGLQGSARMVGLWAACKAYRRPFSKAIDGKGISRPAAYALRDKGLSIISQGLARDRVKAGD